MLQRPMALIHDYLARAGFVLKHLKSIHHTLSAKHIRTRVELAGQMLQYLLLARHQGCDYRLGGKDSWFHLNIDSVRMASAQFHTACEGKEYSELTEGDADGPSPPKSFNPRSQSQRQTAGRHSHIFRWGLHFGEFSSTR
jgi:hypothetical protein